jgi:hypothetical protein
VSAISISSQCEGALAGLATGPASSCLNADGILNIAVSNQNASVVSPFNTYLTGLCSATLCSNSTLSSVVTNLTSACSSDVQQLGITLPSNLVQLVQQYYPTVIDAACLKLSSNNTFCATQLLTNLQSVIGTISSSNIVSLLPSIVSGGKSIPSSVTCNDCTKEMYNIVAHSQPSLNATISQGFSSECGADFTNGASPTDVFEATGTATAAPKSAGFALGVSRNVVLGIAASSLTAVLSAFVVLA